MVSQADLAQQTRQSQLKIARVLDISQIVSGAVAIMLGVIVQLTENSAQNVASPTILRKFAAIMKT